MNFREQYRAIFGEEYRQDKYKFKAHSFNKRIVGKQYCSHCGLLALNNDFTRWSIKMGCNSGDHPNYKNERRKASLVK